MNKNLFENIIETTQDGFLLVGETGEILDVNSAYCNMSGYSKTELLKLSIPDIESQESGSDSAGHIRKIIEIGADRFESTHRRKDGSCFMVDVSTTYLTEINHFVSFIRDISDRNQVEETLRQNEERLRHLSEATFEAIVFHDEGLILHANDQYYEMFGYTPEELSGIDAISITVPPGSMKHIKHQISSGHLGPYKSVGLKKNRIEFPIEIQIKNLEFQGQHVRVAAIRDLTEQRQAEERFKASEERSRTWLEHSPVCTKIVDLDFNLQYMSFAGIKSLHVTDITPFYGKPYPFGFYPETFKNKMTRNLEKARETGEVITQEAPVVDTDGNELWFHSTIVPVKDDKGRIEYFTIVSVDTTERKKAENALQENEEKFRNLLESTSTVPWELDLENSKFTYMGHQIEHILGYSAASWKDINIWAERVHPDDREESLQFCEIETKGGRNHDFMYRAIHKDGSYRWIRDVVSVVMDSRTPKKLIGFMQDITEQKKMEHEQKEMAIKLQQAQKMEAIGTLAGGIAHDFNNILGVILGYSEMALEDTPPGTQLAKDLDKILNSANRATDLVKQILDFSRQAQVERHQIRMQPIIKEGLKMLRSSIPTTISITQDIDPHCGSVLADPTQIHQIIMNLCTNAYHAMDSVGGTLSVLLETTLISPDEQEMPLSLAHGEYVKFTVADTGVGIDPDVITKIFDPYFTTKDIGKGTGMGLAIIHGIMKDYDGTITVESQLGKGSIFHAYFPVVTDGTFSEEPEPEDMSLGNERILFVDDEEILAEMGKTILERLGYHVTVRTSSMEALTTFQNTPNDFDLVITDQTMPEITGSDLARRMMQIRPDIPIILCTGYSNLIDEHSAKVLGIKEFVLKPLSKAMISVLIRKVLETK